MVEVESLPSLFKFASDSDLSEQIDCKEIPTRWKHQLQDWFEVELCIPTSLSQSHFVSFPCDYVAVFDQTTQSKGI